MVLKTSMWAKRRYVRFKRWQPKVGRWADWGLRRRSALRREALRKEREELGCPPPADEVDRGPDRSADPRSAGSTAREMERPRRPRELTLARPSTIGAPDSGCPNGGPFSLII